MYVWLSFCNSDCNVVSAKTLVRNHGLRNKTFSHGHVNTTDSIAVAYRRLLYIYKKRKPEGLAVNNL